ncbi:MAG: SDR family oxidoreductase [Acidimicrobiia bacterium]|nr:SDR family oxidoreductase [Acidimicrobiia bacterium]
MADLGFGLQGRLALVTGCRRGIGLAVAEGLAEAGANIIGVSVNMEDDGGEARRRVEAAGRRFTGYRCDFRDRAAVYAFLGRVEAEHGVPDILVNNAGEIRRVAAADYPDEWWDDLIEIDLTAKFLLTREMGKRMVERGSGKIIFTASVLSSQGGILVPAYTAAMHGVAGLIRAFANEWAPKGVNVNGVAPGYINTDNTTALRADPVRSAAILSRIPAGRWGEPEDFKGPVVFLASEASSYVHGAIIPVDGGWMGR